MINSSTAEGYHRYRIGKPSRPRRHHPGRYQRIEARKPSFFGRLRRHRGAVSIAGLVACLLFYGATASYGVFAGGHWSDMRAALADLANDAAMTAGFEAKSVRVDGRQNMKEADIATALGAYRGKSIFAFDTAQARAALKQNGWVREARVMRLLPSTLVVELEEHEPFALWQEGGRMAVIDVKGDALALASREEFPELPVVSGPGAAKPAKEILAALDALPDLESRVQTIERIAGRRWDLVLDTGLKVKLPTEKFLEALTDLSLIARKNPAAFYEISEMDFRVASQFTVRLKDESDKGREQFLSWLSQGGESYAQGL